MGSQRVVKNSMAVEGTEAAWGMTEDTDSDGDENMLSKKEVFAEIKIRACIAAAYR
jgi:hypothetical protein